MAAALVIGDGVAEFVVRKTEAARVKLMSVSDDVIEKARTLLLHLCARRLLLLTACLRRRGYRLFVEVTYRAFCASRCHFASFRSVYQQHSGCSKNVRPNVPSADSERSSSSGATGRYERDGCSASYRPVTFLQRRWDAAFKIQLWARICMAKGKVYLLRDKRRDLVRRNNAAVWMQVWNNVLSCLTHCRVYSRITQQFHQHANCILGVVARRQSTQASSRQAHRKRILQEPDRSAAAFEVRGGKCGD